jgi:hypothetical protein
VRLIFFGITDQLDRALRGKKEPAKAVTWPEGRASRNAQSDPKARQ